MALQKFDELNNRKSMPYEQYFGEMILTDLQKKLRTEVAKKLEYEFWLLFDILDIYISEEIEDLDYLSERLKEGYIKAISEYVVVDDYINEYVDTICKDIIKTTYDNKDDAYYLSEDRVVYIAENESNSVMNYEELQEAIVSGKTKKTWITLKDKKVRHTHYKVDEKSIYIDKPFLVGRSLMQFPKDTSLGAEAKEIINCRCSVKYS